MVFTAGGYPNVGAGLPFRVPETQVEQLIYISTARSIVLSAAEIQDILEASRHNNARDGLTGLLIVGDRRFLQVLEGDGAALERAYARIKADPRHFAMVELGRKSISQREFGDWAMGYESGGEDLRSTVSVLTNRVADPSLKAQLQSFADIHTRAA